MSDPPRQQPDLFEARSLYRGDPPFVAGCDTSEAAALSFDKADLTALRARVFRFVEGRPQGATCDEAEVALSLRHQTASARIRELVQLGAVQITHHRRATRSGRMARVYKAAGGS